MYIYLKKKVKKKILSKKYNIITIFLYIFNKTKIILVIFKIIEFIFNLYILEK